MSFVMYLRRELEARLDPGQRRWLDVALDKAERGTTAELLQAYTGASRLGRGRLRPQGELAAHTEAAALDPRSLDVWTLEDTARLLLLLCRHQTWKGEEWARDAAECFEQGASGEQQSWLRSIAALPQPERFLSIAVEACRTNIVPLFEALACENPYPAAYFPEPNFNQLVLKALFNRIALTRIVGLERRLNPELARMARDYAAERSAAGRDVPGDISLVTVSAHQRKGA